MKCERCQSTLKGKQQRFCSERCGRIVRKVEYRKRNIKHVRQYAKEYRQRNSVRIAEYNKRHRAAALDAYTPADSTRKQVLDAMPVCQRCGAGQRLQLCHVKPHWAGGTNQPHNFTVMCPPCHSAYDRATHAFWAAVTIPSDW